MIPKIEFVYFPTYDEIWLKPKEKFSSKFVDKYLNSIEKIWKKEGKNTLEYISKISGLKWKEKKIKCYFISGGRCFSNPLTVRYFKNKNQFIDVLTHELIHQMQSQNSKNWVKWWQYFSKQYSNESKLTQRHIFLHAIHYQLL